MNEQQAHNLTELANRVFADPEKAKHWLHSPSKDFKYTTPAAHAGQSGRNYNDVVEKLHSLQAVLHR